MTNDDQKPLLYEQRQEAAIQHLVSTAHQVIGATVSIRVGILRLESKSKHGRGVEFPEPRVLDFPNT